MQGQSISMILMGEGYSEGARAGASGGAAVKAAKMWLMNVTRTEGWS